MGKITLFNFALIILFCSMFAQNRISMLAGEGYEGHASG
jgi:hypothetical protein